MANVAVLVERVRTRCAYAREFVGAPRDAILSAPSSRSRTYSAPNSRGRLHRSAEAKEEFLRRTGYPQGRKGYVVDHIVPLCAGGADASSNMQWQTVEEAKVKDRQERAMCARGHRP